MVTHTVPGMKAGDAEKVNAQMQDRFNALNDLVLTRKHVHWNVTGPHFIAVHTMLDPQVDAVRLESADGTLSTAGAGEGAHHRRTRSEEGQGPLTAP